MTLDPEARAYLDRLSGLGLPPVEELTPDQARQNVLAALPAVRGELEAVARREDREIAGVPCRVVAPSTQHGLPVLVYFHGGGWVTGDLDTHEGVCRALANRAGCIVVAVDYRLAPEQRWPAAVEDAWAVTEWLGRNAAQVGGDRTRLAVAGDSAGGNLAAVVARRARDGGEPSLSLQLLIYPVIDHDLDTGSYQRNGSGYLLTRASMAWYWDHYLPEREQRGHPDASPLRAADLRGVAPAVVLVCEYDPLLDEGRAYAGRLRDAGVPVTVFEEAGMIHGFIRLAALISRASKSWDDLAGELRKAFA